MTLNAEILESVVGEFVGKQALPLLKHISGERFISELELADNLKTDINYVRNKLYLLANHNIAYFKKKRDKIKGWYIYYWRLKNERIIELYEQSIRDRIDRVEKLIEHEDNGPFFGCENGCIRVDFCEASMHRFMCPECTSLLFQEDTTQKKKKLEAEKKELCKKLKKN